MNAYEKQNGNLIVHGTNMNTQNRQMMVIMELTANGDSIWKQTTTSYDTTTTNNFMESGKLTPDGGMVFAGWVTSQYLTPSQQMWLVKTDSLGCDGTQWTSCGTTYVAQPTAQKQGGLRVWPNPAKNILFLEINKEQLIINNNSTSNNKAQTPSESNSPFEKGVRGIDLPLTNKYPTEEHLAYRQAGGISNTQQYNNLTIEQFNTLTIENKLKYSSKNPKNTYWGEKEKQQMLEIQRQYAYMLPFEAINGKVDIFSIDPALNSAVIASVAKQSQQAQSHYEQSKAIPTKNEQIATSQAPRNDVQEVSIYDIFGRLVKTNVVCHSEQSEESISINISTLQSGIYIIKVGNEVAKFVKE